MISKIKKPVSILLVFMMIVSLFAAVPMTVNAAPPGGDGPGGTGTEIGGTGTVITPTTAGDDYLTFTAVEAGSSVTLNVSTGSNLQYKNNNSDWASYTAGTRIDLASAGDSVRFRGKDTTFSNSKYVSIGGKVACSGNVMSLRLDDNGEVQGLSNRCFNFMFKDCAGLTAAPKLPETTLAPNCYSNMFNGCTSLTTAPELPATMLESNCYNSMFYGCRSLTTAPELPATTLATYCYSNMFNGCRSLTTAPELPATMLATNCYINMFNGCENLTTAPELPATSLAAYCYSKMFNDCTNLTVAPALPATALASSCYSEMFAGCGNLTTAPELPATTLAFGCYGNMFAGCSSIKLSETQTAEYSIPYRVPSCGDGTPASSSALSNMFAGTGGTFTGTPEIYKTYYRPAEKYTVTWKNEDGTTLKTDTVAEGNAPAYTGETPEKADDATNTYTFSGWTDGTDTYGATDTLPAVTGDITYTATYTAKPKKLITGQSITLDGNIGINFYLDPAAAGLTVDQVTEDNLSYTFAWADGVNAKVEVAEQSGSTFVKDGDLIKVTCKVCAAEMTCDVNATFTLKGKTESKESKTYSVRQYADTILSDATKPEALKELIKAMLNYGAMAQTKFKVNTGKLANDGVTYNPGDVTDAKLDAAIAAANGTDKADNMNDVAAQHGAKWYSTSLIYLDNNTIRHYFVKATDAFKPSDYPANKANYYYYVQVTDIPAAELDNLQTFTVGTKSFKYSPLDFVKGMINSSADGDSKNLAKSLYWYNQAANKYFPAPAHVHTTATRQDNVVNATCTTAGSYDEVTYCSECNEVISTNHVDVPATGHTIVSVAEVPATTEATGVKAHYECSVCGKLFTDADGNNETTAEELVIPMLKILDLDKVNADTTVENGYTVIGTLKGDYKISIADGATVTLKDVTITCLTEDAKFAGITPVGDATIMLEGANTVKSGYEDYPGILVPENTTLTIDGTGSLDASSNYYGGGIGGGYDMPSGNIEINGGIVNATSFYGAGIGSGYGGEASCGSITINGGIVNATGGNAAAGIGSAYGKSCGTITINGGTVNATGGNSAAGIGSGYEGSCGNITIAATVTKVTATKGYSAPNSIGAGKDGTCGTVTIDGVVKGSITVSPYTYEP